LEIATRPKATSPKILFARVVNTRRSVEDWACVILTIVAPPRKSEPFDVSVCVFCHDTGMVVYRGCGCSIQKTSENIV